MNLNTVEVLLSLLMILKRNFLKDIMFNQKFTKKKKSYKIVVATIAAKITKINQFTTFFTTSFFSFMGWVFKRDSEPSCFNFFFF